MATRPWSYPASAMPVIVTLAYLRWMRCEVDWLAGVWTLVTVVLFHAAANTWSDYFDFKKGVDREDTIGGVSLTSGAFSPKEIMGLAIFLLALAVVMGLALVAYTGMPSLWLGLAGCALIVLYPFLKYNALGDVDIFITFSLLPILGTSFAATGFFYLQLMWLTVPVGLITVGILHINNTRDIEHDRRAGISTFAMLAGRRMSVLLYCFEVLFPFVWVVVNVFYGFFPLWSLLVLPALIPAVGNARKSVGYLSGGAQALTGVDEATAKLQLMFSLLLSVSLIIASLFV